MIDPYIDSKVQVIATGGKVLLSTSKGLYAFDAVTGAQSWVFGTELPTGNSPTVVNKVVYLPGFDHRIQALSLSNGNPIPGYTPFEAGAGFETNPLVINNTIYAGNRDGNFYAFDAVTGVKEWQYLTGGPIRFSAAYKNNVIYFASDHSYAYALNASDGTLLWKSAKLPGAGFSNYWPVVYTDAYTDSPTYGKTFVIFTASKKAVSYGWWGKGTDYQQENYEIYANTGSCPASGGQTYLWQNSATSVLNCSSIFNYF